MALTKEFSRDQVIQAGMTLGGALASLLANLVCAKTIEPLPPVIENPGAKVLGRQAAADYLDIGLTKFDELRDTGIISPVDKAARRPKFLKSDMDAYLDRLKRSK